MECDLYVFKESFYILLLGSNCLKMKVEKKITFYYLVPLNILIPSFPLGIMGKSCSMYRIKPGSEPKILFCICKKFPSTVEFHFITFLDLC